VRINEQFNKQDNPFALTINEDDYMKRMRRLQTELDAMTQKIGDRFESRISNLEKIQDNRVSGLAQLLEGYETAQKEQFNLLQNKVYAFVDDQTSDCLQKATDHINESIVLHRKDLESMMKRLGNNIQTALNDMQRNLKEDIDVVKEDQEAAFTTRFDEMEKRNVQIMNQGAELMATVKEDFEKKQQTE